jgi:predicted PurR-regulated permease PerM
VPEQPHAQPPSFFRRRAGRITIVVLAGIAFLVLAGYLRRVTAPLAIGLAIAYILDPVVTKLTEWRMRRVFAVLLVYVVCLTIGAVVLAAVIPPAYSQVAAVPSWVEKQSVRIMERINAQEGAGEVDGGSSPEVAPPGAPPDSPVSAPTDTPMNAPAAASGGDSLIGGITEMLRSNADTIAVKVLGSVQAISKNLLIYVGSAVTGILNLLTTVVFVLIYTFFFLMGMQKVRSTFKAYLPGRHRDEVLRVVHRLDASYSCYLRGRAIVCTCSGILTSLGLLIVGVPFWLLIGMVAGFLGIVPYIGVLPVFVLALVLGSLTGGVGGIIGVMIVFALAQVLESILIPLVLSKGMKLHPVSILVALLVGAELFGVFGMIISVPLAATVKILMQEFVLPPLKALADEKPEPE